MFLGIKMLSSEEYWKANLSIKLSFEPDWKLTVFNFWHSIKQKLSIFSILFGHIKFSIPLFENDSDLKIFIFEFESKLIVFNCWQFSKLYGKIYSIKDGIVIDVISRRAKIIVLKSPVFGFDLPIIIFLDSSEYLIFGLSDDI